MLTEIFAGYHKYDTEIIFVLKNSIFLYKENVS